MSVIGGGIGSIIVADPADDPICTPLLLSSSSADPSDVVSDDDVGGCVTTRKLLM